MSVSPNAPMISVTLEPYMKRYPPPYLKAEDTPRSNLRGSSVTWTHNPAELTVCLSSSKHIKDFPGSIDSRHEFTSVQELDYFAEGLLSRPLLMDADLTSGRGTNCVYKVKLFITVNTSHPVIKSQILKALNQARTFLNEGRKFRIEINFNSVVADWITRNDNNPFTWPYRGSGAKLVIANKDPPSWWEDAGCCTSCLMACCCLLICPVSCPAYMIYKSITVTHRTFDIQGEIKHLVWINNLPVTEDSVQLMFARERTASFFA